MPDTESTTAHRLTLSDSASGVACDNAEVTPATFGLDSRLRWSIRKRTLRGGKQDGVGVITIDNGALRIELVEHRGLNVLRASNGDVRLGWDSPVDEVVHPKWIDLNSRGGLGWLEGFNEFVARCGLEYAGAPGVDRFRLAGGVRGELNCTLHGRISNLPASRVEVLVDRAPPHRLRVRGEVLERQLFGPNLRLTAEVSTEPLQSEFRIADEVTNLSGGEQEYTLIHHNNYGRPLLEAGATLHLPARTVAPMNAHAAASLDEFTRFDGPTPGFAEQVYLCDLYGTQANRTAVLLHNAAGDRGASARWSLDDFPCFTLWKNTAAESDGYVGGLEPGTCFPHNRQRERDEGRLPRLAAGETRSFVVDHTIHHTPESVAAARAEIERLSDGRETHLERRPATDD